MLKVRVQGTRKDIHLFCDILKKSPQVRVVQISKIYSNKGTDKYFRMYADIQIVEFKEDK